MKRLPTWLEIDLDRLDRNLVQIQDQSVRTSAFC